MEGAGRGISGADGGDLYNLRDWIVRLEAEVRRRHAPGTDAGHNETVLMEALAELHIAGRSYAKALMLFLQQGSRCSGELLRYVPNFCLI